MKRLRRAEDRRNVLRHKLAQANDANQQDVVSLIPRLMERYRAMVAHLPGYPGEERKAARDALFEIFGEIRLERRPDGVWAELSAEPLLLMVAGAGFEPATFGL